MLAQLQGTEKFEQLVHRQLYQFGNIAAVDFYVSGLRAQPAAFAIRAFGLAPVARHHHAVLYLVHFLLQLGEEIVNAPEVAVALPEQPALCLAQVLIGLVHRKAELMGRLQQAVEPAAVFLAAPAGDSAFVYRLAGVGHHLVFVYAHHLAEALAGGAGTVGIIEIEKLRARLQKGHAV